MNMHPKKLLTLGLLFFVSLAPLATSAAVVGTANDFNNYVPYTGLPGFGSNMGYYGQHLRDQDVAQLAYNAGSRTIRPSLPDWLITGYGLDARIEAFQAYNSIGMRDLTAFVGEPNDPAAHGTNGPDNRETRVFPGADERARTFKGLYEPIWLDSGHTQINPANTYAAYLYKTVSTYGQYVKFWEIVNEPDFTYTSSGWVDKSDSSSWWNKNPNPNELTNLKAPIYYYIRELRVAYDVIKTLYPNSYVATGGIGYPSFLDAVMRNTDNPVDGSVTSEYPNKGGAYFDMLSFHTYPMYGLRYWDNSIFDFRYTRHSDAALDAHLASKNEFQSVLDKYGYNGSTYPKKQWMVTETDLPQRQVGDDWGSLEAANNYIVKAHVMGVANGIVQTYKYGLGQDSNSTDIFNTMGLYGALDVSSITVANAPKTGQWKVMKTLSDTLYGKTYDASETARLSLPSHIRGAAFRDISGRYTYVLWAKTTIDKSESASASYTFPFAFSGTERDADFSISGQSVSVGRTVTLTGSPAYFIADDYVIPQVVPPYNPPPYPPYIPVNNSAPRANAGVDKTVAITTKPSVAVALSGEGTDSDGTVTSYSWTQISGPTIANMTGASTRSPIVSNLSGGTYVFRLTVTDNYGAQGSDEVQVSITGAGRIMTTATLLNVRKTAGGVLLGRVSYGNRGLVLDQVTLRGVVWKKISFDSGIIGWVSARYLKAI